MLSKKWTLFHLDTLVEVEEPVAEDALGSEGVCQPTTMAAVRAAMHQSGTFQDLTDNKSADGTVKIYAPYIWFHCILHYSKSFYVKHIKYAIK
jgi:hypothetical protein